MVDPTAPNGFFGVLLAFAFAHCPVSAADAPIRAANAPALEVEAVNEWERALVRESAITLHLRSYYLNREPTLLRGPAAWAAGQALAGAFLAS